MAKYHDFKVLFDDLPVEDANSLLASKSDLEDVVVDQNKRTLNIIAKYYNKVVDARAKSEKDYHRRMKASSN